MAYRSRERRVTLSDIEIPGFELESMLGTGGFGAVWLADQPSVGRKVAVKVGHQALVDDMARLRFERECRALGRLSGRSDIVAVHVAGTLDDGRPYIVMEYVDGGTLWDRIQQAPLSAAEVATVGGQLCIALDHAHQADILHRDVKPENVFVRLDGSIVLGDFGIAAVLDTAATRSGVLAATIPYSPPEVLNGARANVASDLYSVGATLLASATRAVPFLAETDESLPSLLGRVMQGSAPDIRDIGYPDDLARAVEHLMATDPAARPATAAEAAALLTGIATRLDVQAGTVIAPVPRPQPGTVVAPARTGDPITPPAAPVSFNPAAQAPAPYTPAPAPAAQTPAPYPTPHPQAQTPPPTPAPAVGQYPTPAPAAATGPGGPYAPTANPSWGPGTPTGGIAASTGGGRTALLIGAGAVAVMALAVLGIVALVLRPDGTESATPEIDTVTDAGGTSSSDSGSDSASDTGDDPSDNASSSDTPASNGSVADGSRNDATGEPASPTVDEAPVLAPIDTPLTATDLGFPDSVTPLQIVLDDDELGFCDTLINSSNLVDRKEVLINNFLENDQVGQTAYQFTDEAAAIAFVDEIVASLTCVSNDGLTLDGTGQGFTNSSVEVVPQQTFGDDTRAWESTIVFDNGFVITRELYVVRRYDRVISVGYASDEPSKAAQTPSLMELVVERLGYDA